MNTPKVLLKFVAKAVLNAVGAGVVGDVVVDVLPEVAKDVWEWWGRNRTPEERRAEISSLAQAQPAEVRQAAAEVVAEVAPDRPLADRLVLESYLGQMPAAVRQTLRRPSDPTGKTVPANFTFGQPVDLLGLLPSKLPRFKPGDRPLTGVDWELVELLGSGGFGEVWKARNPHFAGVPPVALKFCLDPAAKDRLLRHEAGVLNQVMLHGRHPGIVPLRQTYLSAEPPCLEYEYVAGGELTGIIQDYQGKGGLPPRQAAAIVEQLAAIVGVVHRLKPPIVHRDLKPANVLVERHADGKLDFRIADFGIGGAAVGQAIQQSRIGRTRGEVLATSMKGAYTPLYASPQQMLGESPDPRDDVYSLGVIWFQMLTGNLSAGRPGGASWKKDLAGRGVKTGVIELLESCFDDNLDSRPKNAAALAEQLAKLLVGEQLLMPCPRCHTVLKVAADLPSGKKVRCPKCNGIFIPKPVRFVLPGGADLGGSSQRLVACRPGAAVLVKGHSDGSRGLTPR